MQFTGALSEYLDHPITSTNNINDNDNISNHYITAIADTSDLADYSIGGPPTASEISLSEADLKKGRSFKIALEDAYKDLEEQIRLPGRHNHNYVMSVTQ